LVSCKLVGFSAVTLSTEVDTWINRNSDEKPHVAFLSHVANNRHTFSPSLHTVTLHVTVFNPMGGYQAFKAAHYLRLHPKSAALNAGNATAK